jgi:hypothetical protein
VPKTRSELPLLRDLGWGVAIVVGCLAPAPWSTWMVGVAAAVLPLRALWFALRSSWDEAQCVTALIASSATVAASVVFTWWSPWLRDGRANHGSTLPSAWLVSGSVVAALSFAVGVVALQRARMFDRAGWRGLSAAVRRELVWLAAGMLVAVALVGLQTMPLLGALTSCSIARAGWTWTRRAHCSMQLRAVVQGGLALTTVSAPFFCPAIAVIAASEHYERYRFGAFFYVAVPFLVGISMLAGAFVRAGAAGRAERAVATP